MLIFLKCLTIILPLIIMGFSIYYLVDNIRFEKSKSFIAGMIISIVMSLILLGISIYVGWFM